MSVKKLLSFVLATLIVAGTGCPSKTTEVLPIPNSHSSQEGRFDGPPPLSRVATGVTLAESISQARGMTPFEFEVLPSADNGSPTIWVHSAESSLGPGVHLIYGLDRLDDELFEDSGSSNMTPLNLMIMDPPGLSVGSGWSEDLVEDDSIPAYSGTQAMDVAGYEAVGSEKMVFEPSTLPGVDRTVTQPAFLMWYVGDIQYRLEGTIGHTLAELIGIAESIYTVSEDQNVEPETTSSTTTTAVQSGAPAGIESESLRASSAYIVDKAKKDGFPIPDTDRDFWTLYLTTEDVDAGSFVSSTQFCLDLDSCLQRELMP